MLNKADAGALTTASLPTLGTCSDIVSMADGESVCTNRSVVHNPRCIPENCTKSRHHSPVAGAEQLAARELVLLRIDVAVASVREAFGADGTPGRLGVRVLRKGTTCMSSDTGRHQHCGSLHVKLHQLRAVFCVWHRQHNHAAQMGTAHVRQASV